MLLITNSFFSVILFSCKGKQFYWVYGMNVKYFFVYPNVIPSGFSVLIVIDGLSFRECFPDVKRTLVGNDWLLCFL